MSTLRVNTITNLAGLPFLGSGGGSVFSGASIRVFPSSGTSQLYVPTTGKISFLVIATGGGGGGGGGNGYTGGVGGGGAGTAIRLYTSAEMGTSAAITIGAGGGGGNFYGGGGGGTTTFDPGGTGLTLIAYGGGAGGPAYNPYGGGGGGTLNSLIDVIGSSGYQAGSTFWGGGPGRGGPGGGGGYGIGGAGLSGVVLILEW